MQAAALAISSLSVVTKEALYHYTLRVGEGSNSDSVSTFKLCYSTYAHAIRLYVIFYYLI